MRTMLLIGHGDIQKQGAVREDGKGKVGAKSRDEVIAPAEPVGFFFPPEYRRAVSSGPA